MTQSLFPPYTFGLCVHIKDINLQTNHEYHVQINYGHFVWKTSKISRTNRTISTDKTSVVEWNLQDGGCILWVNTKTKEELDSTRIHFQIMESEQCIGSVIQSVGALDILTSTSHSVEKIHQIESSCLLHTEKNIPLFITNLRDVETDIRKQQTSDLRICYTHVDQNTMYRQCLYSWIKTKNTVNPTSMHNQKTTEIELTVHIDCLYQLVRDKYIDVSEVISLVTLYQKELQNKQNQNDSFHQDVICMYIPFSFLSRSWIDNRPSNNSVTRFFNQQLEITGIWSLSLFKIDNSPLDESTNLDKFNLSKISNDSIQLTNNVPLFLEQNKLSISDPITTSLQSNLGFTSIPWIWDRRNKLFVQEFIPKHADILNYRKNQNDTLHNSLSTPFLRLISRGFIKPSDQISNEVEKFKALYNIDMSRFEDKKYRTLDQFLTRPLSTHELANIQSMLTSRFRIISPSDGRISVNDSQSETRNVWIMGQKFSLSRLLSFPLSYTHEKLRYLNHHQVLVSRIAPQDYHRFHSPFRCKIVDLWTINRGFQTVNPVILKHGRADVFTQNKRDVLVLDSEFCGRVYMVAVGSTLPGSIQWSNIVYKSLKIREINNRPIIERADELGFFLFGGSTIVTILPPNSIEWDPDILRWNTNSIECLVWMGDEIGTSVFQQPVWSM